MRLFLISIVSLAISACAGLPKLDTPEKKMAAVYSGLTAAKKTTARLVATKIDTDNDGVPDKRLISADDAERVSDCIDRAFGFAETAEGYFRQATEASEAERKAVEDQAYRWLGRADSILSGVEAGLRAAEVGAELDVQLC